MTATIWTKFFWADWSNDEALKLCSFAAQGLWMRMLCIAAGSSPIGYVSVNGNALDETGIARLTGADVSEVANLLSELERNGVFSRDRHKRIYSRRMIRDAKKRATAQKNGQNGGNPRLSEQRDIPSSDKGVDKGRDKPQEPRASIPENKPIAQQTPPPRAKPMLLEALFEAAGLSDAREERHPGLLRIGHVADLVTKGYDLEADILPIVRELAAAGTTYSGWSYIVPIVIERAAKRAAIPQRPSMPTVDWSGRLNAWRHDGTWATSWGPKPDEPGCNVPAELLTRAA